MTQEEVNQHMAKLLSSKHPVAARPRTNLEDKDERELQDRIAAYLRMREIPFFRQRMDKRTTGTIGWPDFSFVIQGKACFFECKVAGRTLSEDQERMRIELVRAGARYSVIYGIGQAIAAVKMWSAENL